MESWLFDVESLMFVSLHAIRLNSLWPFDIWVGVGTGCSLFSDLDNGQKNQLQ